MPVTRNSEHPHIAKFFNKIEKVDFVADDLFAILLQGGYLPIVF
jgi:hypothetical protein